MVEIEEEPEDMNLRGPDRLLCERCCFCRRPTRFWTLPVTSASVACCPPCAKVAEPKDLPKKRDWFKREIIAGKGGDRG